MQSLFLASATAASDRFDEALIQAAIERVVDGTDARLRAVGDYRKKLRDSVVHAMDYVVTLVDSLPPSRPISKRRFSIDPHLRAFFVSPDHLQQTVSFSQGFRNYLRQGQGSADSALPDTVYAVLGMERCEKTVLGMALDGDIIQHSVPQITVSFSNHGVAFPASEEHDTRRELKKRAFDHLIKVALQELLTLRVQKRELERQRVLLRQKANTLKSGKPGLDSLMGSMPQNAQDFMALEERIQTIEKKLERVRADSGAIDHHLTKVRSVLAESEKYLRLEQATLHLDQMNHKVPDNTERPSNRVDFNEAVLEDGRKLVISFICYPRDEILMPPDPFEEARRFLL